MRIDLDVMSIASPVEYDSSLITAAASLNQHMSEVSIKALYYVYCIAMCRFDMHVVGIDLLLYKR